MQREQWQPSRKYSLLYANYPKQDDSAQVKKLIGGHVDAAWLGRNTCTIRLSRALNYPGHLIRARQPGLATISGADHRWYAFRMQELKRYLTHLFGQPTLSATKGPGNGVDRSAFSGRRGIIAFDIHFSDAEGHLDLWDGNAFIHEHIAGRDYFASATKVVLWEGV